MSVPTHHAPRSTLLCLYLPCTYLALATLVVAFYLLIGYLQNGAFGFPLDDAWIHQVYARNLGTRSEFSFFPGQPSAGSTSPLWAILLAVGYVLRFDYRAWAIALGVIFLAASAWAAHRVAGHFTENSFVSQWFVPLFILFEWHMVWAAVSGMEIIFFVFLALLLIDVFWSNAPALLVGIIAGLLTLTRPEGIVLAGLVGVGMLINVVKPLGSRQNLTRFGLYSLAFLLPLFPYLVFNLQASGTILPNTFYAKAAEYAELTVGTNFFARWLGLFRQPLIGGQLLLVPGLGYCVWRFARDKKWQLLLPAAWILLLPALYAWRLPVEYQFGRYEMPIIPFMILYGLVGTAFLFQRISLRILRRAWGLTIAVLLIAFLILRANFYAQSVAVINCEMVATAQWTRANLSAGAHIAVHDIGAQGYFDEHPLLDMAGLVSPEVIPFIRDQTKLLAWMQARGAKYAIFFPDWYPQLAGNAHLQEIHSTGCEVTKSMGEENLRVYEIK